MRIECTESVVVNNIIGSFIKQQPTIEKLGTVYSLIEARAFIFFTADQRQGPGVYWRPAFNHFIVNILCV